MHSRDTVLCVVGCAAGGAGPEGVGLHAGRRHRVAEPLQQDRQPGRTQDSPTR